MERLETTNDPHTHILRTMKDIGEEGFGKKNIS
jgi:hypothetical protein